MQVVDSEEPGMTSTRIDGTVVTEWVLSDGGSPMSHSRLLCFVLFLALLAVCAGRLASGGQDAPAGTIASSRFPCPAEAIPRYSARRVAEPITIDGRLDEKCWQTVLRSPRFVDVLTGEPTLYDTRAAVLWDDRNLYVAYWVEEPKVAAKLTEYGSYIYQENDVELFVAGRDAYYELELNARNTIYEVFFIWEEAYSTGGYDAVPEFSRSNPKVKPFSGVGFRNHPRGRRLGSWAWRFPGLQTAVHVDGTLNDDTDRDKGWTVEIALPWTGMKWLAEADKRALPPRAGDVWRLDFSRFNQYKAEPPARDSGGWFWSPHRIWDSHIPECFTSITFVNDEIDSR
jgi:hypothetical protein